jgi:hypothetical protein
VLRGTIQKSSHLRAPKLPASHVTNTKTSLRRPASVVASPAADRATDKTKCFHYPVTGATPDTVESRVVQRSARLQSATLPAALRVHQTRHPARARSTPHELYASSLVFRLHQHVCGSDTPRVGVGESVPAAHRCCDARRASRRACKPRNPPAVDV